MSADDKLAKLHAFYNFPFLKNESFKSFLKELNHKVPATLVNLKSFILKAQIAFYISFVDSDFDSSILRTLTKAKESKCPFAAIFAQNSEVPIACMNIFDRDEGTEILVIGSVEFILTSKTENVVFNNITGVMYVIPSDSTFTGSNFNSESYGNILQELLKTKQVFTASDLLFLFPNSVFVIERSEIDLFLNLMSIFDILNIDKSLENFRSTGITAKNLPPSPLEPYADLLSVEYIRANPDFFK